MTNGNYCGLNVTPDAAKEMMISMIEVRDRLTAEWDGLMTKERKRYLKDLETRIEMLNKIKTK